MWNRKELKERARSAVRSNYIACLIVGFILAVINYTTTNRGSGSSSSGDTESVNQLQNLFNTSGLENVHLPSIFGFVPTLPQAILAASFVLVIGLLLVSVFVMNVFEVGGAGFFYYNRNEKAQIGLLLSPFTSGYYINTVVTILVRNIKLVLWTLLFIVPGIVKNYEYRMIPYILADHPEIGRKEAFKLSRRMMDGNKMNAFVLDLSFIGWNILSSMTLGLVGIFWSNPYQYQTNAELYAALKDEI